MGKEPKVQVFWQEPRLETALAEGATHECGKEPHMNVGRGKREGSKRQEGTS